MAFRLRPDEYFHGLVRQPGTNVEFVVVEKGTRAAAVSMTVREADRRNWDWVIELRCRAGDDEEVDQVTTLGHWSSMEGNLPPPTRAQVPGLN